MRASCLLFGAVALVCGDAPTPSRADDGEWAGGAIGEHAIVAFVHIQKTGGTTMGVALYRWCKARGVPFYTDMIGNPIPELAPRFVSHPSDAFITQLFAQSVPPPAVTEGSVGGARLPLAVLHGHSVDVAFRAIGKRLAARLRRSPGAQKASQVSILHAWRRETAFVTHIREPGQRIVSKFLQMTATFTHQPGADISLQNRWLDKGALAKMFAQWFATPHAQRSCPEVFEALFGVAVACGDVVDPNGAMIASAREMMRTTLLVLVTERQFESISLLDRLLFSDRAIQQEEDNTRVGTRSRAASLLSSTSDRRSAAQGRDEDATPSFAALTMRNGTSFQSFRCHAGGQTYRAGGLQQPHHCGGGGSASTGAGVVVNKYRDILTRENEQLLRQSLAHEYWLYEYASGLLVRRARFYGIS